MKGKLCLSQLVCMAMACVAMAGLAAAAGAQTILLDLGNDQSFRGASVTNPDVTGNYWNSVWAGAFYPNILDIDGNATAVDFGFSLDGGNDSFNGPAGVTDPNGDGDDSDGPGPAGSVYNAAALGNLGVDAAVYDYYVSSRFEIQQLDPTKRYNITFFGSHKFNGNDITRYTIYTDGSFSTPVASADLFIGTGNDHNQDTVVTINGLAPQTANILYVGFSGAGGGPGYLNALQITAVPEPSTLFLLAGGAAVVFGFWRRGASRR
jgi:hypothetical protein